MASSVDGLISGLDTTALISQLMQVEAAPQQNLQTKVAKEKSALSAYQSINTRLAALQTAAEAMSAPANWKSVKVASSSSAVSATATSGAITGNLTFNVINLARGQISTAHVAATGPIAAGNSLSLTIGTGDPVAIDITADKSAAGVAKAINAQNLDVKAALINTTTGTVLQLTSTKTGIESAFALTGLDDPLTSAASAADALIRVGDPLAGGYEVTSATNTFSNLMSGVTINVTAAANDVTIGVSNDPSAIAAKMKAMVDAANATLTEMSKQSTTDSTGKTTSPLTGDFGVRQLSLSVLSAVSNGLDGYGSFKQVGVQLDRNGQIKFDQDAFLAAYAADPVSVEKGAKALADGMSGLAEKSQATVTKTTQSHNSFITALNDQIASWDIRLTARQDALQKQFSGLELALGKLKNQSTWLSGAIAGLPTSGS